MKKKKVLNDAANKWLYKIFDREDIRLISNDNHFQVMINGSSIDWWKLGNGIRHIIPVIVVGLMLEKDEIFFIQNPTAHIYPKYHTGIGEFISYIVLQRGIHVVLEIQSDHILNKLRYNVYKKQINHQDIVIHFFSSRDDISTFYLDNKGNLLNKDGYHSRIPEGFFDASLREVYEMNMEL